MYFICICIIENMKLLFRCFLSLMPLNSIYTVIKNYDAVFTTCAFCFNNYLTIVLN